MLITELGSDFHLFVNHNGEGKFIPYQTLTGGSAHFSADLTHTNKYLITSDPSGIIRVYLNEGKFVLWQALFDSVDISYSIAITDDGKYLVMASFDGYFYVYHCPSCTEVIEECLFGYYLDSGKCHECDGNCFKCETSP